VEVGLSDYCSVDFRAEELAHVVTPCIR